MPNRAATPARPTLPLVSPNAAETWRFGVEIELYVPNRPRRADDIVSGPMVPAFATSRDGRAHDQYHGHRPRFVPGLPAGWHAQRDGSVTGVGEPSGTVGCEVISPILGGLDGLRQVAMATAYLRDHYRAVQTKTCGGHVHIDATHLTNEQCLAIQKNYIALERGFFALNGPEAQSRFRNTIYCNAAEHGKWNSLGGDRHRSLNTTNLADPSKRTIEFRLFAGTLEPLALVGNVVAAIGLAVATLRPPTQTHEFPVTGVAATRPWVAPTGLTAQQQVRMLMRCAVLPFPAWGRNLKNEDGEPYIPTDLVRHYLAAEKQAGL